jgi:hypothetical protein
MRPIFVLKKIECFVLQLMKVLKYLVYVSQYFIFAT